VLESAPAWEPLAAWMLIVGEFPPELARGEVALTPVTVPETGVPQLRFPLPSVVSTWLELPADVGRVRV